MCLKTCGLCTNGHMTQVQKPTRKQSRDSSMGDSKVFVVYIGQEEIGAMPMSRVKSWGSLAPPPKSAKADLKSAVCKAQLILNSRS